MKRTRQVFHYNEDAVPSDISGCRMFHGEDLRKFHIMILLSSLPSNYFPYSNRSFSFPRSYEVAGRDLEIMGNAAKIRKEPAQP